MKQKPAETNNPMSYILIRSEYTTNMWYETERYMLSYEIKILHVSELDLVKTQKC